MIEPAEAEGCGCHASFQLQVESLHWQLTFFPITCFACLHKGGVFLHEIFLIRTYPYHIASHPNGLHPRGLCIHVYYTMTSN